MDDEATFRRIVDRLRESSHGSATLAELSDFVRGLKKRKREFLEPRMLQRVITWDENKERRVWTTDQVADDNQYWFLQGYIIHSSHVRGPNGVENHITWLVLAVDCDCVRSPYISVTKIIPVSSEDSDHKEALALAISFKTVKYFPIPPYEGNADWGLADLETPFFLERAYVPLSASLQSLTVDGWHILNAVLQHRYTRAFNISESEELRKVEANPPIN